MNIDELDKLIRRYDDEYHTNGVSLVSDAEFDDLCRAFEEEVGHPHPVLGKVGGLSDTDVIVFDPPMLSLGKVHTEEDLVKWVSKTTERLLEVYPDANPDELFHVEPKYDGCAVRLVYNKGKLVEATTRGDGTKGTDILRHIRGIPGVPRIADKRRSFEVRGEIVVDFEQQRILNEELVSTGQEPVIPHRNFVSGTLKLKTPSPKYLNTLVFSPYYLCTDEDGIVGLERDKLLHDLGFEYPSFFHTCNGLKNITDTLTGLTWLRSNFWCGIDGLVFKVTDPSMSSYIDNNYSGSGAFPASAIAYKYAPDESTATVTDIRSYVGRTGLVTPVATITPCNINNVVITSVNLSNLRNVQTKDIRIGDEVTIARAGDVIPYLKSVVHRSVESESPPFNLTHCPSCSTRLVFKGVGQFCTNEHCEDRLVAQLTFFSGVDGLDIRNLGEVTIRNLVDVGRIKRPSDLYNLEHHHFQNVGFKTVSKILIAINESKLSEPVDVVRSLGIPGIGRVTASLISRRIRKLTDLLDPSVVETFGLGEAQYNDLLEYTSNPNNADELRRLDEVFSDVFAALPPAKTDGRFAGQSWAITGTFPDTTRDTIKRQLVEESADYHDTVKKTTSHLLVGESPSPRKVERGLKYGCIIVRSLDEIMCT